MDLHTCLRKLINKFTLYDNAEKFVEAGFFTSEDILYDGLHVEIEFFTYTDALVLASNLDYDDLALYYGKKSGMISDDDSWSSLEEKEE